MDVVRELRILLSLISSLGARDTIDAEKEKKWDTEITLRTFCVYSDTNWEKERVKGSSSGLSFLFASVTRNGSLFDRRQRYDLLETNEETPSSIRSDRFNCTNVYAIFFSILPSFLLSISLFLSSSLSVNFSRLLKQLGTWPVPYDIASIFLEKYIRVEFNELQQPRRIMNRINKRLVHVSWEFFKMIVKRSRIKINYVNPNVFSTYSYFTEIKINFIRLDISIHYIYRENWIHLINSVTFIDRRRYREKVKKVQTRIVWLRSLVRETPVRRTCTQERKSYDAGRWITRKEKFERTATTTA